MTSLRLLAWALVSAILTLTACDKSSKQQSEAVASVKSPGSEPLAALLDLKQLGAANQSDTAIVQALKRKRPALDAKPSGSSQKRSTKVQRSAANLLRDGYRLRKNPPWMPKPPIDWGHNPAKDSNWHYVINSLRPVDTLLSAHDETGEVRYFSIARSVALDWIDYNMVQNKPNQKKWHDMGTALRAERLARILDRELRAAKPDEQAVKKLVWALHEHAAFLKDPKVFTLGNHGVYMMLGLARVLKALPELREAKKWSKYSRVRMKELLHSQFSSEGMHLEHSPGYHILITKTFGRIADSGLFDDVVALKKTVDLARERIPELYHPNGDLVMLGDGDRDQFRKAAKREAQATTEAKRQTLRAYPEAGYAIFRSHFGAEATPADDYLLLGTGHHSRVHKHADQLSFEWSFRGVPVLIDSGKYTYNKGKWREFFLSTRAGNAVEVDEKDYSVNKRGRGPSLEAWGSIENDHYMVAEAHHEEVGVEQVRLLFLRPGKFLVVMDLMKSGTSHRYRQWFHLHEALAASQRANALLIEGSSLSKLVAYELSGKSEPAELSKGQTRPRIQGFVSTKYNVKQPRTSVAFKQEATDATFATLFSPDAPIASKLTQTDGTYEVRWTTARGKREGFDFTPGQKEPVRSLARRSPD